MATRRPHVLVKYPRLRKHIPASYQECVRFLQQHIFLWRSIFGDDLLGIWYSDNFSHDNTYRNLKLEVWVIVRKHLTSGVLSGEYRFMMGKYLFVRYLTEEEYLEPWQWLNRHWYLLDRIQLELRSLYKKQYLIDLEQKARGISHLRYNYLIRAKESYDEVLAAYQKLYQEINGKREVSSILAWTNHLMQKVLVTLAYCNECSYQSSNIFEWAQEALSFTITPTHFEAFVKTHLDNRTRDPFPPKSEWDDFTIEDIEYPMSQVEGEILKPLATNLVAELGQLIEDEIRKLPSKSLKFQIPDLPL